MRAASIAIGVGTLLMAASSAHAHTQVGDRAVIVQAEKDSVAVLVTYRPPQGAMGALEVMARARSQKAIYGARALAALDIRIDGVPLRAEDVKVKLAEDHTVVVLVVGRVPAGEHKVTVDVTPGREPTQTEWLDRSGGRVVMFGPAPAGQWIRGRARLELHWRK